MKRASASFTPEWSVFRGPGEPVLVPRAPLLVRLRSVIPDTYFAQGALVPLKRFMDGIFIAGPLCIIVALYLPTGGGLLVWLGLTCLAIASLYWFAPHFLCRHYLTRKGYRITGAVTAGDFETACTKAGEMP